MKTFAFINLAIDGGYQGVHHGVACLIPIVRQHGYTPVVLNLAFPITPDDFMQWIRKISPSIVGFSLTSLQRRHLRELSNLLKQHFPDILQIAGGSGATLEPNLSGSSVDGFCVGEGEIPLDACLRAIAEEREISDVAGFHWHTPNGIVQIAPPRFNQDLDSCAFPDYTPFGRDTVVFGSDQCLSMILSRGCPYKCTYCSNEALRGTYESARGYFRTPSVDYAIDAVKYQLKLFPETRFIHFEDDLLIARKKWFIEFATRYKEEIKLPYRMNVRIECLTPDIANALEESGCVMAFLGVESGNEEYRNNVLKRCHTNQTIIERSALLKKANIKLFTYNIMGFPHETASQMRDTIRLNQQIAPDSGVCTFFFPFPGTELFNISVQDKLLDWDGISEPPTNYNTRPIILQTAWDRLVCTWLVAKLRRYLHWQDVKYKRLQHHSSHTSMPQQITYTMRLVCYFLARSFISQNAQRRVYHLVMNNRLISPLAQRLFRGVR